ncbi:ATP-dependent DNA helicase UvrD/PcrA [Caldisalinibacter kiritimatiensis]|uniref:DNA 3'-5' helicase n=2 Tax=Caldisalinibacter kiritimatiensis TaxID=1304284 RepID=R1CD63_9FIRM|nr:ATP-dependent DNA helicase UvrD/PcrA [Caldisalinibacter kiritimatiensis]
MNLTDSQRKAVETIDKNVAVNAGAGSGKTRVLVERYIYILENGVLEKDKEIESILAITFTNKAAAEMKERVRKSVSEKIVEDKKWKRIYMDIDRAQISTIHSFCSKILRENPIESKLTPGFSVLEDYEADNILKEIIETYINEGLEKDHDMFKFFRYFTADSLDKSNNSIIDNIKNLYNKIRSTGFSFIEVKNITLNTIDNLEVDISLIEDIKQKFIYLMSKARKNSKFAKLEKDNIWIQFKDEHVTEIDNIVIDTLKYLSQNIGKMKNEEETIKELKRSISEIVKIEEKNKRHIYEKLLDILIDIDTRYSEEKRRRGVLDYEDLQLRVLKLLDNNEIRKKYQKKFRYIMVDEFQDTNELQKKIIYKLCSENSKLDRQNLFVVGDPKQSIYRFRGADVEVFYDVMNDINEVSNIEPITLEDNFRTVDSVMGFINSIFERVMGDAYDKLRPNKESSNKVDVEVLECEDLQIPEEENKAEYVKKYESELIAKRIKKLVEKDGYRYRDIALLFRSTTDNSIYEEALKQYGIPFYNIGSGGFFKRQEIIDIINALKAINNRFDTLSVVATLRSPMFGLSDNTLYWILRDTTSDILERLNEDIHNISKEEREKVKKAYEILTRLNNIKSFVKVYDLINELIEKTYYIETCMLKFGNKQTMANIVKFTEMAREFSQRNNSDLQGFLDYIDNKIKNDIDEGQAQVESEEGNTVKIMTIHKSKGLQFKVVIVPQLSKQFNFSYPNILFDKKKGIGIKHPNKLGKPDKETSHLYKDILEAHKEKDMEENKRILYVAMTRAEEKLIIGNQSTERLRESFKKLIQEHLEYGEFERINNIEVEKGEFKQIVGIDIDEEKPFDKNIVPLLKTYNEFNSKSFNRFTVTQYMTFNECQRKFYMTYYKGLPSDESFIDSEYDTYNVLIDPAIKGQIVHKICETYSTGMDVKELTKNVVKAYNIEPSNEILDHLRLYVDNYIKHYRDDYDHIFNEKEFYYRIKDKYIYGIIDRVNIKGNTAEIIDFKTNRYNNKQDIVNKYASQIQLYTSAFKDIYDIEVKRAGLMMLETGEFIEIDIDKQSLDNNKKALQEFIQFVNDNKEISMYKKGNAGCKYCRFNGLCTD